MPVVGQGSAGFKLAGLFLCLGFVRPGVSGANPRAQKPLPAPESLPVIKVAPDGA